jgi:hypothetical protein
MSAEQTSREKGAISSERSAIYTVMQDKFTGNLPLRDVV